MVAQLRKILGDNLSSSTISTKDIKVHHVYHGESYHRKLSDSNYPQKPNYKENIHQNKKQN